MFCCSVKSFKCFFIFSKFGKSKPPVFPAFSPYFIFRKLLGQLEVFFKSCLELVFKGLFGILLPGFKPIEGNSTVVAGRQAVIIKCKEILISFKSFPVLPEFAEYISFPVPGKGIFHIKP